MCIFSLDFFPEFRTDEKLIEVIERLGEKSWASWSNLVVEEISDDCEYEIQEYHGYETLVELY